MSNANDQTPFGSSVPSHDSVNHCMGKFKSLWVNFGERKLETSHGKWNRAGHSGKEMWPPVGIWDPLLRFIGVGILWNWGIIHGKAFLSGPVYKMRQGWQRWRPSTTGPSCVNMGLSHLTYTVHHSKHSACLKETHISLRLTQYCTPSTIVSFYHGTSFHVLSVLWNSKAWPQRDLSFSFWLHTFSYHKT